MMDLPKKEATERPWRTANETIVSAMEQFSQAEPKGLLIIHTDESDSIVITGNVSHSMALGMMAIAKYVILNRG